MPDHIYVFADASTKVYSTVIYLHYETEVSLAMSKCRVAPLKSLTLPRLELMVAITPAEFQNLFRHLYPQMANLLLFTFGLIAK